MNKKTRWRDIPEEFITRYAKKAFTLGSNTIIGESEIIGEFNCLRQIKPGDTVRFLNSIFRYQWQWAFDQPNATPIKGPYIKSGDVFYFDAVAVRKNIKSKFSKHLDGYFFMSDNNLVMNNYGPSALSDIFVSSQDRKNLFDIKLIEDLYKIGYGYSFWATLTDHTNFIPIKVFKS